MFLFMLLAIIVRLAQGGKQMSATSRALSRSLSESRVQSLEYQMNGYFK
jgi:hypothetical protein